jgi:hypothetical protein
MSTDDAIKEYSAKWWCSEIAKVEKQLDEKWRTSAGRVVERYLATNDEDENKKRYNIFWANVQILKSALYATPPTPTVARQYGDSKDDVARVAALVLERLLSIGVTKDDSDMHKAFKAAVEDRLVPGMGQVWLRYEAQVKNSTIPAVIDPFSGEEISPEIPQSIIVDEQVYTESIHWRDFAWEPARTWDEVGWVSRRIWLRKVKFIKKFGKEKFEELKQAITAVEATKEHLPKGFRKGRVEVYEVWCKDTNKIYWCSPVLDECLDIKTDFLKLDGFFPCPKPLLATHSTDSLIPRPDYVMAQDQYDELDVLNTRINALTRALRVVGAYDSTVTELKSILTGPELNMVAVDNWAAFAEKNGMKGSIDWYPVEQVAGVLEKLMLQRQAVISQIYELTSISDIMRGSSNPRETAKAQTLKAQYSSVRLQLTQQDVGEFVRHAMRIKAEIISKHFQPDIIIKQSQMEFTESAQFVQPAVALLKQYDASRYRIEISEESLSIADYNAEREMRMEYLTAVGQFVSQTAQMTQGMPQALPFILQILQWATSAFKASSDIETVFDQAVAAAQQIQAPPPAQEKPDSSLQVASINANVKKYEVDKDSETKLRIADMNLTRDREAQGQKQLELALDKEDKAAEKREKEIEKEDDQLDQIKDAVAQLTKAVVDLAQQQQEILDVLSKEEA